MKTEEKIDDLEDRVEDLELEIYEQEQQDLKEWAVESLKEIWKETAPKDVELNGYENSDYTVGIIPKNKRAEVFLDKLTQRGNLMNKAGLWEINKDWKVETYHESSNNKSGEMFNHWTHPDHIRELMEFLNIVNEQRISLYLNHGDSPIKVQSENFIILRAAHPGPSDQVRKEFEERIQELLKKKQVKVKED